jgi:hypothetical protein
MFNARAGTRLTTPPSPGVPRRRCLVPVDSFYEEARGHGAQPYRVARTDGDRSCCRTVGRLARSGDRDRSADVHDRHHDAERGAGRPARSDAGHRPRRRLGAGCPTIPDRGELLGLLEPNDAVGLEVYPVRRLVNDVRQDGPALIERLAV